MKIDKEILNVLSNSIINENSLILSGQLDRKLYLKTNEVLVLAGGKWDRKTKSHLFKSNVSDIIDQIILTEEILNPQEFGYFPTPEIIVKQMIDLANISPEMLILEPSAGQGAIAKEIAKTNKVDCVEILQEYTDILSNENIYNKVINNDFLDITPTPIYDRVVMNPPFSKQADIKHVLHALKFLKPNGLLVSVMSASVCFRENALTKEFRELVNNNGRIIPLPENSFKLSGTNVNTVLVCIDSNI